MPTIHLPAPSFVMLRPPSSLPSNQAIFQVPRYLQKSDIQQYLEAVYRIRVLKVNTAIMQRKRIREKNQRRFHRHPIQGTVYRWLTVYKRAWVTFDGSFTFPPRATENDEEKKEKVQEERKGKDLRSILNDWDQVLAERYGTSPSKTAQEIRDQLIQQQTSTDLSSVAQDPQYEHDGLVEIKGSAKKRLVKKKEKSKQVQE